jgi:hypothetical protein
MAESKSDQFVNDFNAHSEKIAKFDPLPTNRLAADSECHAPTNVRFRGWVQPIDATPSNLVR